MSRKADQLPSFQNPPVVEVVCGVQFEPLAEFATPHVGLYWELLQPQYGLYQEQPALPPALEPDELLITQAPQIKLVSGAMMPRVWFVSEDGAQVVQVQKDRFLTNWRKTSTGTYPRYASVIKNFNEQLSLFRKFLEDGELGTIKPVQYEMTYINQMPMGEIWEDVGDLGLILPDASWRQSDRFLPDPETLSWSCTFKLPNKFGRLHVAAGIGERLDDKKKVMQLTLTARGIGEDRKVESMQAWFDLAREWIVKGFADVTGPEPQQKQWRIEK